MEEEYTDDVIHNIILKITSAVADWQCNLKFRWNYCKVLCEGHIPLERLSIDANLSYPRSRVHTRRACSAMFFLQDTRYSRSTNSNDRIAPGTSYLCKVHTSLANLRTLCSNSTHVLPAYATRTSCSSSSSVAAATPSAHPSNHISFMSSRVQSWCGVISRLATRLTLHDTQLTAAILKHIYMKSK